MRIYSHKKIDGELSYWKVILINFKIYVLDTFIWLIAHSAPIFFGLISRTLFNCLSNGKSVSTLTLILVICLSVLALRVIFIYSGASIDTNYRITIKTAICKKIIARLGTISHKHEKGRFIDCINTDVDTITNTAGYFIDMLANMIFSIVAFAIMLSINWFLALFMFIPMALSVIISTFTKKKIMSVNKKNRDIEQSISEKIHTYLGSYEMIKMSGLSKLAVDKINECNAQRRKRSMIETKLTSFIDILNQMTGELTVSLLLLFMMNPMRKSAFSIGDFSLFLSYCSYITDFTQYLTTYLIKKRQSQISIENLNGLVCNNPFQQALSIKPSCLNAAVHALISPDIDIFEIIGKNGSGKSLLCQSIIEKFSDKYCIGIITQKPVLFNATIKDNIVLGRSFDKNSFLEAVGIASLSKDEFEDGYNTYAGSLGNKLSGGQIFRIALARTIYESPKFIIVDGGINSVEEKKRKLIIERLLHKFLKKIIFTSTEEISGLTDFTLNIKIINLNCRDQELF